MVSYLYSEPERHQIAKREAKGAPIQVPTQPNQLKFNPREARA